MCAHRWPLALGQAEHNGISDGAVAAHSLPADNTIFLGAKEFDGTLAGKVEIVCTPADHITIQYVERMSQQQQLTCCVYVCSLDTRRVTSVANLYSSYLWQDVVVAC